MKTGPTLLAAILLSAVTAFAVVHLLPKSSAQAVQESTYEKIIRTGEIHCGYATWNPFFFVDPANGEKKGVFHDLMEEAGKRLGLKIIWQEEVGWGSVVEAVKSKRVDMSCSVYWLNPPRIKNLSSSFPQLYAPVYAFARQDEGRPFANLDDLNSDKYTVATIDGSAEGQVVTLRLDKAKKFTMPELNTDADEIEALLTGKADFIFLDNASAGTYMKANPGKIRSLFPDQPAVVFPNVMLMPPNEPQLKEMIDDIFRNIEYDGTLDSILTQYGMQSVLLRNPKPAFYH